MMRPARRASLLLVAFYMLSSAATAYAECAWVLWKKVGEDASANWSVQWGFPSVERCNAALPRSSFLGTDSGYTLVLDRPEVVAYVHTTKPSITLTCLPDTVDPRGPKGGAR